MSLRWRRQASWGTFDPSTRFKLLYASDDGGKSWRLVGMPGPLQWPQIFSCASGERRRFPATCSPSCSLLD